MGILQTIIYFTAGPLAAKQFDKIVAIVRKNKPILILLLVLLIPLALVFAPLVIINEIVAIIAGVSLLIYARVRKPEALKWIWNNEDKNLWRIFLLGWGLSIGLAATLIYILWVIVLLQEVFVKVPLPQAPG